MVSKDGSFEVRNPAAEELSKLPEFSGGFPAALAEPLASVLGTDEHYMPTDYGRVVTFRVGGEDRHYLPRILAIGDKLTEFKGAAVILQDVTKFRLLDDAKTNLVGTVSHELKTPLTGLRMAVYLLLEKNLGPLTPAQREMLESARDDANRLLRILDSLLDLTRLEAGASALERRRVPVAELIGAVADEARSFISAAGQSLVVRTEPGLGEVNVDADRLRHVFINLLSNASKYSPAGGDHHARRRPGSDGLRALLRPRRGRGDSAGGDPAHLRPVLPGARPVQAGRRDRPRDRPRDRRRPRRHDRLLEHAGAAGPSSTSWCLRTRRALPAESAATCAGRASRCRRRCRGRTTPRSGSLRCQARDAEEPRPLAGPDNEGRPYDERADDHPERDLVRGLADRVLERMKALVPEVDREVVVFNAPHDPAQLQGHFPQSG